MATKFRSHYDGKRIKVGMHFNKPSLTEKIQGHDLDINAIVNRYHQGIYSPVPIATKKPTFAGVFKPNMYEESVQYIRNVQNEFNSLPSNIRARFDNDPNKLLNFLEDSSNIEEAHKLGLLDNERYQQYIDSLKPVDPQVTVPVETGNAQAGSVTA